MLLFWALMWLLQGIRDATVKATWLLKPPPPAPTPSTSVPPSQIPSRSYASQVPDDRNKMTDAEVYAFTQGGEGLCSGQAGGWGGWSWAGVMRSTNSRRVWLMVGQPRPCT